MGEIVATTLDRQQWFTAQEIADAAAKFGVTSVPPNERSVRKLAEREGWNDKTKFCRKRTGRGGGKEYHLDILPSVLRVKLDDELHQFLAKNTTQKVAKTDQKKRAVLDTTKMSERHRRAMDARLAVLNAIDAHRLENGTTRRQAILAFLDDPDFFGLDTDVLIHANDRKKNSISISRASIYDWFKVRETDGVSAVAPVPTKCKADAPEWAIGLLRIYGQPHKPALTEALDDYRSSLPRGTNKPIPNYDQARRLLARLGNVEKHRGREGPLTLLSRLPYVTRTTGDLLPLDVITGDGKTFDAEVQHPGHGKPFRPEITTIMDVATRMIVGFSVDLNENTWGVADAIRNAVENYGVPAIFYVDNGSGFKNKTLDRSCVGLIDRLGTTKKHSLPRRSQSRGGIERVQKTVWNRYAKKFETYIGEDMDREKRQRMFKITRKDLREFGTSSRLPTWKEFVDGAHAAIERYNHDHHSTIDMSPVEAWQKHVDEGFEPVILLDGEADGLFRPYEKRRVQRCLIQFNNNKYFSDDLTEFNGDDVFICYDINDPSRIWVWSIEKTKESHALGQMIAIADYAGNEKDYFPKSVVQAAQEKRAKGRLARAQVHVDEINDELNSHHFLDHQETETIDLNGPIIDAEPLLEDEVITVNDNYQDKVEAPLRFEDEADLALWAIANPDQLTARQIAVLRECMSNQSDKEIFEMSGVDLERLKAVIRAAA